MDVELKLIFVEADIMFSFKMTVVVYLVSRGESLFEEYHIIINISQR